MGESSSWVRKMSKMRVQDGATHEKKICSEIHQKDHSGLSSQCIFLGSISSQQKFEVTDVRDLSVS